MAAYASLVSLMDLMEQIQRHPNPPLSLDPKQAKSLTDKIRFLQRFLEDFHSRGFSQEIQSLESRIRDVAHAAEDVIESPMQDMDRKPSTGSYEGLQRVIQDMELVKKEVMDTEKKKQRGEDDDDDKLRRHSMRPPSSLDSENATTMVGFDHILIQVMDRLTRKQSRRDIIPLVGMGGSGKTTLARNIYENQLIVDHFHARSWATISQQCVVREVLIDCLLCLRNQKNREALSGESENNLGLQLHQSLCGRKYLVVLDDLWSLEAWNKLKFFFPDQNNGSRILITTRLTNLADELTGSHSPVVNVDLLDDDTSWDLLYKKVFADKICPSELVEIGRMIARNCRGLPLSIVTIGGHLAMSSMTRDYWEHVAENLSSLVNSDDDHRCLRILSLSYVHLPVHLKPCFLYMGLFPEDKHFQASRLIRLWVAEGILKPIGGKTLEEVGKDYLKDLVERNLVLVHEREFTGEIQFCGLHDLLRDLCIREAQKEKFFFVAKIDELQGEEIYNTTRRLAIHGSSSDWADSPHYGASYSAPFLRSCIFEPEIFSNLISLRSARLLRIFSGFDRYTRCRAYDIVPSVNMRCLCLSGDYTKDISSLWSMSWNLQTIIIRHSIDNVTLDIWKMPQLRHVEIYSIYLPDPPPGQLIVLENLQTLLRVRNFNCSEEVVERIPNIKNLEIYYFDQNVGRTMDDCCLNNLGRLKYLESLDIAFSWLTKSRCGLTLPCSLKRLTLAYIELDSDVISNMIGGSLPLLEVLKLQYISFIGDEWNPVEGQFCRLKYPELSDITGLKLWNAETTHFPSLECLGIVGTNSLEEFPWSIGDIPTLRLIRLFGARDSVLISAKLMLEEQEQQFGNVTLLIEFCVRNKEQRELAESLASNNFKTLS